MSAEWQARQLLLIASAPGPFGNMSSPGGRSTLTDFSDNWLSARAQPGARATPTTRAIGNRARPILSSSGDHDGGPLDDVAHEPARIPIGRVGLRLAAAAGAADHQHLISLGRRGEAALPLSETVLAFVRAERRFLPALAAIAREIDPRYAGIAAERDAARDRRSADLQRVALLDVCDEGSRHHTADRHELDVGFPRPDVRARRVRDRIGRLRPVIRIRLVQQLDVEDRKSTRLNSSHEWISY